MEIKQNANLKAYNTFGIEVTAHAIARFTNANEAKELLAYGKTNALECMVLGGGSNLLFTQNFPGLIMLNDVQGIEILEENDKEVILRAGAGVDWHALVMHCVNAGYGGIENMSLIPGKVGAAPMQNIGAYGVELKDVFVSLKALEKESGNVKSFDAEACAFGYRESYFKRAGKDQFIILSVDIALTKNPVINTRYGSISEELQAMGIDTPTIKDVSNAVITIRSSKLPDPGHIGNAGSFFKNPVVPTTTFKEIQLSHPNVVGYPAGEGLTKLAAGWLIEHAGWKGHRKGDFGVHEKQALVLVNYGNAAGKDIYALSSEILESVKNKFGVDLEREVNIY